MNSPQVEKKIDEILHRLQTEAKTIGVYDGHWTLHCECRRYIQLEGLWLEFGVYRGRTLSNLATLTNQMVYGFDAFEGLPDHWDNDNPKGVYSLAGNVPVGAISGSNDDNPGMYSTEATRTMKRWPHNVRLVPGWFDKTLPAFLELYPEDVAFLHVDSDVYSSCKTVLTLLRDRIKNGTVIIFDEICDYPDFREHEIKAFAEFLLQTGFNYIPLVYQNLGYSQGCFKIVT